MPQGAAYVFRVSLLLIHKSVIHILDIASRSSHSGLAPGKSRKLSFLIFGNLYGAGLRARGNIRRANAVNSAKPGREICSHKLLVFFMLHTSPVFSDTCWDFHCKFPEIKIHLGGRGTRS
jgi:hypothetical protein